MAAKALSVPILKLKINFRTRQIHKYRIHEW